MKKPSLVTISQTTGYSLRTIFRVLSNNAAVKAETREKIVRELNVHGYCVENHIGTEKVVVDVSRRSRYTEVLADEIIARLNQEQYRTVKTFSYNQPNQLKRELADAHVVIFTEHTQGDWNKIAQEINPDIYRVNIFGENSENSELNIAADNLGGTLSAVHYLCSARKCKNIAVFQSRSVRDSRERAAIFYGSVAADYPDVRCELVLSDVPDFLTEFYRERGHELDGCFYTIGTSWTILDPLFLGDDRNPCQVLFNNPKYTLTMHRLPAGSRRLDAYIDFEVPQIWELTAFYLRNRPLLLKNPRQISLLPTILRFNETPFRSTIRKK